ncbi:hypothetical protein SMD44_08315 [Streptomyces alboflavus]|uniref:Uncharacterized protein n=1 Tax=Streptomyces alboflavus TaxID=67267 RepID=A0A1Z1WQV4_9ACTN|nr:hypothetical protein SMD44_08315 [Streptomyces alboflavus]
MLARADLEEVGAHGDVGRQVEVVAARRGQGALQLRLGRRVTGSGGRARSGGRMCWRGSPSCSGKTVRRDSCRATRSATAARSAGTSRSPLNRRVQGTL